MDIFSNPTKVHGRVLWANPFTISHFPHESHWYWDVGRPEWVSGPIPTTARNMDIFSNPTKVHGRVLWANPLTISHFPHESHWYWDVGWPEWVSGPIPTTAPWSRTGWPVGLHTGYQNIRLIPECNISHNRNILNLLHRIPFTDMSLSLRVLINPHT